MYLHYPVLFAATLYALLNSCLAQSDHLNLTTIAVVNGVSVFQCWQLDYTLDQTSSPAGISSFTTLGPLGDPVNATWMSVPAGSGTGQQHQAAAVEYNIVLLGTLLLNVNSTGQSAKITGGAHGLILVTDTVGTGHSATISHDGPGVVLMMPIKDNIIPDHTVLHDGECLQCEMDF